MQPVERIPPAPWMRTPATRALLAALTAEGAVVRFVGGCVRDSLVGRPVRDIDVATATTPRDNLRLLTAAGIKAVPTGIEHGTITAVVGGRPFEVTTLRVDVETFGRHARVAFTDDWVADACRRDFTINALYADPDGSLYDPTGGLADLRRGRVRFVGRPEQRIEEDRLRILRFFRFHAWYGRGAANRSALAACRQAAAGIDRLSGERVRQELLKLLAAPEPRPALRLMLRHGILPYVLPAGADLAALSRLMRGEPGEPDPLLRLAALMHGQGADAARRLADRLRLSNAERERLLALLGSDAPSPRGGRWTLRRAVYRLGADMTADLALLAGRPRLAAAARAMRPPEFPLKGRDGLALGLKPGPELGRLLAAVEDWWVERDFAPDTAACRAHLAALAGKGK